MVLRVAVAARTLCHSTQGIVAPLFQCNGQSPLCLLSTTLLRTDVPNTGHVLGFLGLAPSIAGFQPFLGTGTRKDTIPIQRWWKEEPAMGLMSPGETITREQLVLAAANVDKEGVIMKEGAYERLQNGLGLEVECKFRVGGFRRVKLLRADLAALRQIGYEIISSPDIRSLAGLDHLTKGKMAPPPKIDIEKEMNRYVRAFGGSVVTDLVGPSPPFANADYAFPAENIVAELKCLNDDKSEDAHLQENLEKLIGSYIDSGLVPDPGPGRFVFNSAAMPAQLQKDVYKLFARPIKRRIDKANRQIRQTKKHLNLPDAQGLLLLVNDGNFKLEPAQWVHAVDVALGKDFSSINGLILFTVNMVATSPQIDQHVLLWIPVGRKGHAPISESFLRRFSDGWHVHHASLTGETIPKMAMENFDLEDVHFDRVLTKARVSASR